MTDIKTRELTRGSIKTIDRAAASMHRLKVDAIRRRSYNYGSSQESDNAGMYAEDHLERTASDSAAFASRSGVEMLLHSREKACCASEAFTDAEYTGIKNSLNPPINLKPLQDNGDQIRCASREQGIKSILTSQRRTKLTDAKSLRDNGDEMLTGYIRRASTIRKKSLSGYSVNRVAKTRIDLLKSEDATQRKRKEYAIKRITERNARNGITGRLFFSGRIIGNRRAIRGADQHMKRITESIKALTASLSAGGIAALFIVVIMILFCAALTFTEDGNRVEGTGDNTIVEVAAAEIGNEGGEKYWKWYGFSSRVDWCAIFCSWCADQCGYIDSGILPRFSIVGDGANWFKTRHRWSGRGYSPKPGDFIFFDYEHDGVLDHVGIVENCDGKAVTTIEGNSRDACKRLSYRVGAPQIAGYGLMIRPVGNSARLIALKAIELAYPDDPPEAQYPGGKPTEKYKEALKIAYPDRKSWGAAPRAGASCDVFVGTVLRTTGIAPDFPRGLSEQIPYLRNSDRFYDIGYTGDRSALKPGDIIVIDYGTGAHICIIVNEKYHICEANYKDTYGITVKDKGGINWRLQKRSGSQYTKVYRVK